MMPPDVVSTTYLWGEGIEMTEGDGPYTRRGKNSEKSIIVVKNVMMKLNVKI